MRLEVTRRADLAVRALLVLAEVDGRVKASELARRLGTTPGFVPHVCNPLIERDWVRSEPGPNGGYSAAAPIASLSVLDVIEAVEGPTDTGRCVLVDQPCGVDELCALHSAWAMARAQLLETLANTSLSDLAEAASPS